MSSLWCSSLAWRQQGPPRARLPLGQTAHGPRPSLCHGVRMGQRCELAGVWRWRGDADAGVAVTRWTFRMCAGDGYRVLAAGRQHGSGEVRWGGLRREDSRGVAWCVDSLREHGGEANDCVDEAALDVSRPKDEYGLRPATSWCWWWWRRGVVVKQEKDDDKM